MNKANKFSRLSQAYLDHYLGTQRGGSYPVFRGAPYQYGQGLGQLVRDSKFLVPIMSAAAEKFLESTGEELTKSGDFLEASKKALMPTLTAAVEKAAGQMKAQKGEGRRKNRKKRATRRRVYKSASRTRKTRSLLYGPTNF